MAGMDCVIEILQLSGMQYTNDTVSLGDIYPGSLRGVRLTAHLSASVSPRTEPSCV